MGTIASTPLTALSVLTAPGAPLSSGSSLISQSVLKSASPTDLASLSAESTALSEANGLFGLPSPNYGQSTPDFFQSIDSAITNASFGLAPAALNGTGTAPSSLDQLLSSYSAGTNNTGTIINTTG